MPLRTAVALAAGLALCGGALAHEEAQAQRRVSFQVERSREVENDWATAVLALTDEDVSAPALADRINRTMAWALERARKVDEVKVRSGGYTTSPVYDRERIARWRASQQLWLESAKLERLTELMGELQERLQVQAVTFSVSPERRRQVEDELIQEALAAYRARAELVQGALGSAKYTLVSLVLSTPGGPEPRPPFYGRAAGMAAAEAVAPPALEGGTSTLGVSASATIELE
jgi:predicted secreted protein